MKNKRAFGHLWNPRLATVSVGPACEDAPISGQHLLRSQGSGDSGDGNRTVRAQRRRRTTSQPEGRERAEAPQRRRPDEQRPPQRPPSGAAPRPSTSSAPRPISAQPSGQAAPGGTLPVGQLLGMLGGGRRSPLLIVGIVALFACVLLALFLCSPRDSGQEAYVPPPTRPSDVAVQATSTPRPAAPTSTPVPFSPPALSSGGQTWLVMLYKDADDKILEQDIYMDLKEAERVGSSDRVHIVAQIDRFRGGYQGDGNWTGARRYYVTQDDDLQRVGSQMIQDLGEVNMADAATLIDFVTWAIQTYPADKHVLIMSDHGMGWPGGWSDPDPPSRGNPNIPMSAALGNHLYLMELDEALGEIRSRTGLEAFELIGMDACLMGHIEVFSMLAPHAHYAVASQETEPALGWAYTGFLGALVANPDISGADLGRLIVDTYIQEDQRIVDDAARADLLRQGSPMGGLFGPVSAEQLAQQMERNITLSAVGLAAMPELLDSVNELSFVLQGESQPLVAQARTYAQSFTSIFGDKVPASYIDLGHFAQLLKQNSRNAQVGQAVDRVLASLNRAVIAERHGRNKPGATGISIYFPNSQLYSSPVAGAQSYTAISSRFAEVSLWDDFLAFHYTGRAFEPSARALVVPDRAISAPGVGQITVSPVRFSGNRAAPGQPVLLSVDISGDNVGHVYLFVGFYDQASNSIWVADTDYLESADTREINGVYYPDWGEGRFTMEFEWEPIVFAIDDGVNSVLALFTPQSYGRTFEEATYTVDGIYTYVDGEIRHARLYFQDGSLRQVFGFTHEGGTGAPREIIPQPGDTFTVLETWIDLDGQGKVVRKATQEGGTLTFGDTMFAWKDLDAPPGLYTVGFVVEDLDGNTLEVFGQLTVE